MQSATNEHVSELEEEPMETDDDLEVERQMLTEEICRMNNAPSSSGISGNVTDRSEEDGDDEEYEFIRPSQQAVEEKMEKIHESQSFIPIPFLKDQCEKTGDMEIEERSLSSTEVLGESPPVEYELAKHITLESSSLEISSDNQPIIGLEMDIEGVNEETLTDAPLQPPASTTFEDQTVPTENGPAIPENEAEVLETEMTDEDERPETETTSSETAVESPIEEGNVVGNSDHLPTDGNKNHIADSSQGKKIPFLLISLIHYLICGMISCYNLVY